MKMFKFLFITLLCVSLPVNAGLQEFIDTLNIFLNMDIVVDQFDAVDIITAKFSVDILEQKNIEEKLDFCFQLFQSFENVAVVHEYKDLQRELIMTVFSSIDMQQVESRKAAKAALISFNNPKFTEYLWTLVQEKEASQEKPNRTWNSFFLELRLTSQVRHAVKESKPVVPARDIVRGALDAIGNPDIQVNQDPEHNPLADTVLIATNFKQAVATEKEIEQAQKILHAKLDRLEQERTNTWNVRVDFQLLLAQHKDHISDEIKQVLSDYINTLATTEKQKTREIEDAKASDGMLDLQRLLADEEKKHWLPLFQQKLDQRIQQRMELERKLKAVNEALDELKAQSKALEQKDATTHDARRLLVASNLHEKLKEGAFNPKNYSSK